MGYPNSKHIRKFAIGQTIKDFFVDAGGTMQIVFENGEALRVREWPNEKQLVCTPYDKNGNVKQSTEINSN